jgi:RNA polymerase sigma-70 factor (ECF subfamily)
VIAAEAREPDRVPSASPEAIRLVSAARSGEERAFSQLYEQYARAVHGVVLAHAPPDDADDLVQETFLMAWKQFQALRDPGAFGGWLMAIARNTARQSRRGALRLVSLEETMPAMVKEPELDAQTALVAIRSLPEAYRETLLLRLVEGMSGEEIAERTGLTRGSVRVNLHRGMQLLRDKLGWKP